MVQDDPTVDHYAYGDALFRVNAGGPQVAALDDGPDWEADTAATPSSYLGGGPANISTTGAAVTLDPSVPATTPSAVFGAERWDPPTGTEMTWNFPVTDGTPTVVRLYFADFNGPTQALGARVFDVSIDGDLVLDDYDIFADVGANTGGMQEFIVVADADGVDIDFQRLVENTEIRAIEIVELVDTLTGFGDIEFLTVIGNPNTNSEDLDIAAVDQTLDGPGAAAGTPSSIAGNCLPAVPATVAPGDTIECRFTLSVTGADADVFQDTVNAVGAFTGGQAADVDSTPVDITIASTAPAPITTRINAAGGLVASTDAGPDWAADNAPSHPTLTTASGSSLGSFPIDNGFDTSVPTYGQIEALYTSERWDGTNGTAPDLMTYEIPVSTAGASATVNLFLMNGWPGSSGIGGRLFDVSIEGALVLDDFDMVAAYGHSTGGMETFAVTDDGDGVITIVFDHGPEQNPLVNAIEVIG